MSGNERRAGAEAMREAIWAVLRAAERPLLAAARREDRQLAALDLMRELQRVSDAVWALGLPGDADQDGGAP